MMANTVKAGRKEAAPLRGLKNDHEQTIFVAKFPPALNVPNHRQQQVMAETGIYFR